MTTRRVLIGIAVLIIAASLIGGAWVLEGGKIPGFKQSGKSGEFVAELPPRVGIDLVLQCDEEFVQEAYKRFREEHLGILTDPIAVPGGVKALAAVQGELPKELEPVKRAIVEALKRHAPRRVVLIAHSECLLYDVIAAWQNQGDQVRSRQEADLLAASNLIKTLFPNTKVEMYYAQKDGDRLRFKPLFREEAKQ